ncbi:MAG: hypothetical protein QG603_682 [Patescibacteria group bacterium]|nr:hypothetical protein [Patescibacteria group bacterium]MDQ5970905.1 hypothetical protein [Patescibacteria group bacterium]
MFKLKVKFLLFLGVVVPGIVIAQANVNNFPANNNLDLSAYRQVKGLGDLGISVPTVVEVPFSERYLNRSSFTVVDQITQTALPYYFKQETLANKPYYSINTVPYINGSYNMVDNNSSTHAEFSLTNQETAVAVVNLQSSKEVTSSALTVLLDKNVALPTAVDVFAMVEGNYKLVLAKTNMLQSTVRFPETTAKNWRVTFYYVQPLRINELYLVQNNPELTSQQAIRFLAQPKANYLIYFDPDRAVVSQTSEAGNLSSNEDVLLWQQVTTTRNPQYVNADVDADGVFDYLDNCVSVYNPDQIDVNKNGRGDTCDDFDKDNISNDKDNCPNNPNYNQRDIDGDGIGDACDTEESRVTEKYKWIPWLGIVFAFVVVIVLFVITLKSKKTDN